MSEAGDGEQAIDAHVFRAPIGLCLDLKNPLAWLAVKPALALVAELDVALECLPFDGPALRRPPPERVDDTRGIRHRRLRGEYLARDIQRYADVQGIEIRDIYRAPDTLQFAAGLLWLNRSALEQVPDYLLTVFREYWRGALDIEAPGAVKTVLGGLGADVAGFERFAREEAPAAVAGLRGPLVAAGIFDTPSFVVEGQVFIGRAHLPMVRWLLEGQVGPPPV